MPFGVGLLAFVLTTGLGGFYALALAFSSCFVILPSHSSHEFYQHIVDGIEYGFDDGVVVGEGVVVERLPACWYVHADDAYAFFLDHALELFPVVVVKAGQAVNLFNEQNVVFLRVVE